MNAQKTSMGAKEWNGKQIGFPGIFHGVPMADYHRGDICIEPSVSSSTLRTLWLESPAHCWDKSPLNPDRDPDASETEALLVGRAAHHLLFGEARFQDLFKLRPETVGGEAWHGNKKVCKEWLAKAEVDGLTVLTPAQFETISGMAKSLARDPLVQAGILNGAIEHSWFWKDTETGLWCKVRPDASPNDSLDFADLKTTPSVQWDDLQRTIRDYGYFQQGALVGEACQEILRRPMTSFSLVFVEKKRPYCVRIVTLKENDLERGRKINRVCLRTFADCLKSGKWPGPGGDKSDASYIELPEWSQKQIDERLKLEFGA